MANGNDNGQRWRFAGWAAGVVLLLGAMWFAGREVRWGTLASADPGDLLWLAVAVVLSVLSATALHWVVTLSFDARPMVSPARMFALIALSGLLNYIPVLRTGLWGRAAYLRVVHQLPVRQSVVILLVVMWLTAVVFGAAAAVLLLFGEADQWAVGGAALVVLTVVTAWMAPRVVRRRVVHAWTWTPIRALDLFISAARLWIALRIVGAEVGFDTVVLAAAASMLVRLLGLTPNGLGLSEWVVAALVAASSPVDAATGAAAAVIDRAVEVVVTVPLAAVGAWMLRGAKETTCG